MTFDFEKNARMRNRQESHKRTVLTLKGMAVFLIWMLISLPFYLVLEEILPSFSFGEEGGDYRTLISGVIGGCIYYFIYSKYKNWLNGENLWIRKDKKK